MEFTMRGVRPSDLEAVHRLNRRCEEHDRIPFATPMDVFEHWLDDPYLVLESDTRVVEAGDSPVAWGRIWYRPSGEREERTFMLGSVDPAFRRRGIGSALLGWQIERSKEILDRAPSGLPRYLRCQAYDFQAECIGLFARHDLAPVRYSDEMLRPLGDVPEPPVIPGITIVPWDQARSEDARIAQNDAFADHWGSTPRDTPAWEHELASAGVRLDLSFFALDGDRIVGVSRNGYFPDDEPVTGRREGWIMNVGVIRSHRKRGIASALIVASLAAFQRAGFTHSALGVDSENPTGAYRLYERLGYRPTHRTIVYQRTV